MAAVMASDFQFEFEPAFPVIGDNNEIEEFAQELSGTHRFYNNDVDTMIRVLTQECNIFPPEPDTELGLFINTLGYMQAGFPSTYEDEDDYEDEDEDEDDYEEDDEDFEEEDPDNRYENEGVTQIPYMNNMNTNDEDVHENMDNHENIDNVDNDENEYEYENLNPDLYDDSDDEDYSSDEEEED